MAAGRVLVAGALADKPSRLVSTADPVLLQGPPARFVGRGGDKLDAALDRFDVAVEGLRVLDAGASTGGFTDCLVQRGAAHVYAVDVGHGQLDAGLRQDPRVTVLERTNIRHLGPTALAEAEGRGWSPVDLVVADLSFISLVPVAPVLAGPLVRVGGQLVVLVKPQFEAGRPEVSRGRGVIRDPVVWRRALEAVASALAGAGTGIMGAMRSPIVGATGNTEFFIHGVVGAGPTPTGRVAPILDGAVAEATAGS